MRNPRSRLFYAAVVTSLAVLAGLGGEAYGAKQSSAVPFPLHFSAQNPHSHLQSGLSEVGFEALRKGGTIENIEPVRGSGFPDPANPLQFSEVTINLRLYCDLAETGELTNVYWIQLGHEGERGIPVHHNKVSYTGTAYDGRLHEGHIAFKVKFTHDGQVAEGSVRVWGEKLENDVGFPLTNCDSEPGGKSIARGKPYKWRLVGAI